MGVLPPYRHATSPKASLTATPVKPSSSRRRLLTMYQLTDAGRRPPSLGYIACDSISAGAGVDRHSKWFGVDVVELPLRAVHIGAAIVVDVGSAYAWEVLDPGGIGQALKPTSDTQSVTNTTLITATRATASRARGRCRGPRPGRDRGSRPPLVAPIPLPGPGGRRPRACP